ncbi:hypothetical protein SAMD00019534_002550 [Acytostelium subglobosum LB1]|uniref:hypothetical protein n=1 Tax=Acytostelium subglobosum LB1 TaxID=1410327 RepID=UPI000644A029|nr:hypothetical protein SAMD00019534_002550 [Acytostelium subglobosum LB1]GAM17080.1 hypothetical protein SAMD00019534_002550 [Acytostelium subglobosum LB1]|eukprot:XP_012759142.1 hypothetical protein SAMD00019534_002550 [Acytostelium subglobosum LB1]
MLPYIVAVVVVGLALWMFRPKASTCGLEHPGVIYNRWRNVAKGYNMDNFMNDTMPLKEPHTYKTVLKEALHLKNEEMKHYEALMVMQRVVATYKKLTMDGDKLGKEIKDYIEMNKEYRVMYNESVQHYDLVDAFFNEKDWTVDPNLEHEVQYSYRTEGRRLRSRKFIKVVNLPLKNLAMRCQEIDLINTWKWYQSGKVISTPTSKGTVLCSIISILSRIFILNRAAYCWKLNFRLPDNSIVIAYNGANNRQSDYDLPALPTGFAYPDIFYHAFRLIPLTPHKTIVISVMESDPKIWFLTREMFIKQGKTFGCRELKLMSDFSSDIHGTPYQEFANHPFYDGL